MMPYLLVVELFVLFLLTRRLSQTLYGFFLLLTNSRSWAISLTTFIFFPGTVIHELAHLFMAETLGVRTGKLTLVPESLESNEIQAGSVMVAKTDPFRSTLIGIAPIIVGSILLPVISYFFQTYVTTVRAIPWTELFMRWELYVLLLLLYLFFAVSNTMFSSKEDVKGVLPVVILLIILVIAMFLAGVRISITGVVLTVLTNALTSLVWSLAFVLGLNIIIYFLMVMGIRLLGKATKRRIIYDKRPAPAENHH